VSRPHGTVNRFKSLGWKLVAVFLIVALLPPAIMFIAAGRADWWEAWIMFGVLALTTIVSRVILIVKHPDWPQSAPSGPMDRESKTGIKS